MEATITTAIQNQDGSFNLRVDFFDAVRGYSETKDLHFYAGIAEEQVKVILATEAKAICSGIDLKKTMETTYVGKTYVLDEKAGTITDKAAITEEKPIG